MTTDIPREGNPTKPEVPYYVKGLALGIPAYLFGVHLWTWVQTLGVFLRGYADFRAYYSAAFMVRMGQARQLYSYDTVKAFQDFLVSREAPAAPFIHPAYEALLYVPFSVLKFRGAYLAFLVFNAVLLVITFRMLRPRLNNLAGVFPWLPAAMFLCFLPIAAALIQGQDSIILLALLTAAAISLERGRELTAGVLVGLGLFRFQITLPVALVFLMWRRWRFATGFTLAAAVVGTASVWLAGVAQTRLYLHALSAMSISAASEADRFRYAQPLDRMGNLRGLVLGLAGSHLSPFWIQAAIIVLSSAVLLWVGRWSPAKRGADALLLAITASAVVSYHLLIHDMSILLLPIALTLNRFIVAETTGEASGRLAARTAALMFVAPLCISFAPDHFYLTSLPLFAFLVVQMQLSHGDKASNILRNQTISRSTAATADS